MTRAVDVWKREGGPTTRRAIAYAQAILAGTVPAGELVGLAMERFLADLEPGKWIYRPAAVERVATFVQALPNIKGPQAGRPLALMEWQTVALANLFGFTDGHGARRFRQAVIYIPRGNGKTTFCAPLALYLAFADGEGGAEVVSAAVTRDQARLMFDTAQNMVRRSPSLRSSFGVEVSAFTIYQAGTASKLFPVSSDARALDGLNIAGAFLDEIAQHKTGEVYDVMLTATGKRRHPLLLSISTASDQMAGIGRLLWTYAERVLRRQISDERLFTLIYTADDGDDPWDEASWIKANPGWGVTVQPDAIRAIARQAKSNPAQEPAFKTKHLNIWTQARVQWFSSLAWDAGARPLELADFDGEPCWIGLDLATRTDLAAVVLLFKRMRTDGEAELVLWPQLFLPEAAVFEARSPGYVQWAAQEHIITTPGNVTDFDRIETAILEAAGRFDVAGVAFDPWNAAQMAGRLLNAGVPMIEFRQSTRNFTEPMKFLQAEMMAGRVVHPANPAFSWTVLNIQAREDANGNVFPRREDVTVKIDGGVAALMACGLAIVDERHGSALDGDEADFNPADYIA